VLSAGVLTIFANGLGAFSLIASGLFMLLMRQPASLMRALIKTVAIFSFAVLAIQYQAPWTLIIALLFASVGDFFLAFDGEAPFKTGLAGFMLAQVAYVVLFFTMAQGDLGLLWEQPVRFVVIAVVVAHSLNLATQLVLRLPSNMGLLIAAYAIIITLMGVFSLAFTSWAIVIGALLFILSDSLIAYERFLVDTEVNQHPWISPAVWVTYYLAQVMITYGVLSAGGNLPA
jgi:uncharacterized membrane protein YhhN